MLNTIAKPFGWLLMWLYDVFGNYGIAIIIFALIVKLIMLPFQMKSKRSMMQTSRIQPRLKELEKKHGANKAKYNEEVARLYKEEKINPMSGCIWTLIPFPILIALYQAIRFPLTIMMGVSSTLLAEGGAISNMLTQLGFTTNTGAAYVQIAQTQFISDHFDKFADLSDKLRQVDYGFLGLNLGDLPQYKFLWTTDWSNASVWLPGLGLFLIPIISAALTFLSSKISTKMNGSAGGAQGNSMQSMMIMMPLISVYIAFIMPAALGVYWIASTLFAMIQDIWLTKRYKKIMDAEDAVRIERTLAREAELEAKRLETERLKAENSTIINPNTSKKKQLKSERQEQAEKAAQWEKIKNKNAAAEKNDSSIGSRRYARGRAYDANRFSETDENPDETVMINENNTAVQPQQGMYSDEDFDGENQTADDMETAEFYEDGDENADKED